MFHEKGLQNETKMKSFGSYLLEKVWKRKSVFGLRRRVRIAYEPILWNAQGDPKIEEKKGHISEALILAKNVKMWEKRVPKGLQKVASEKGVAPLGRLLGHLWFPSRFLTRKMIPRRPQSVPGDRKLPNKWTPKCKKWLHKCSWKWIRWGLWHWTADLDIWPGGLREALWIYIYIYSIWVVVRIKTSTR